MRVTAIRLINFMAFEDTGWIELRSLTLLYGRNSSGKSTIFRALLLLKQSLAASADTGPLVFFAPGGATDQGEFVNIVHRKPGEDTTSLRTISFGFRCDLSDAPVRVQGVEHRSLDVYCAFRQVELADDKSSAKHAQVMPVALRVCSPAARSGDAQEEILFAVEALFERGANDDWDELMHTEVWGRWVEHLDCSGVRLGPAWELNSTDTGFWPALGGEVAALRDTNIYDSLLDLRDLVSGFLSRTTHIGPLRPPAQRVYAFDRDTAAEWRQKGLDSYYKFLADGINSDIADEVDNWMRELGLGQHVDVRRQTFYKLATISQISVDDGMSVNIRDLGFGVSQVLPVLTACLAARKGDLVLIEQPELHLHTKGQAALGDLLVRCIASGASFVLETHSESLLLRTRSLCAQHTLDGGAIKMGEIDRSLLELMGICFVHRPKENTRPVIEYISINRYGDLENFSREFVEHFNQAYKDLRELNKVSAQIRSREVKGVRSD